MKRATTDPRRRDHANARNALVIGLLAAALWLAGCENVAREVRRVTYPPDFQYVSKQELQGAMGRLAPLAVRLDVLARSPEGMEGHRREVAEILLEMEDAASRLNPADLPTQHPLVNANLDGFRQDIQRARLGVEREPPSFLRAGALPGACLYCHGSREGGHPTR